MAKRFRKTHWGFHIIKIYNKQAVFFVFDTPTKTTNVSAKPQAAQAKVESCAEIRLFFPRYA